MAISNQMDAETYVRQLRTADVVDVQAEIHGNALSAVMAAIEIGRRDVATMERHILERLDAQDIRMQVRFDAQDVKMQARFDAQDIKIQTWAEALQGTMDHRFSMADLKFSHLAEAQAALTRQLSTVALDLASKTATLSKDIFAVNINLLENKAAVADDIAKVNANLLETKAAVGNDIAKVNANLLETKAALGNDIAKVNANLLESNIEHMRHVDSVKESVVAVAGQLTLVRWMGATAIAMAITAVSLNFAIAVRLIGH